MAVGGIISRWGLCAVIFVVVIYYMYVSMISRLMPYTDTLSRSWTTLSSRPSVKYLPTNTAIIKNETQSLPTSKYDSRKVALLVETRPLPHLPALFTHMTGLVPPEWTFKFMGSETALSFMRSSPPISRLVDSGRLQLLPIPSNYSLQDRETISQMFTDIHLYRDLLAPAEHLLVWQPDSIFCANAPKTLNDYLEWDWIGAPWSKTAQYGGNGGLSLRKVSKILEVLRTNQRKVGDGALEDLWLTNNIHSLPGSHMPDASISKTFSVESVWDDAPLGYHIGWLGVHHEQIWDDKDQVDHVLRYCPEVKMILGMKLDNDKPEALRNSGNTST